MLARYVALLSLLLVIPFAGCRSPAAPHSDPPFIENDYAKALSTARSTRRPIVVDVWASWCKACRRMSDALADSAIASLRDRFVWLAIDADDTANELFLAQHPYRSLPRLYVLDSSGRNVLVNLASAFPVQSMRRVLIASESVAQSDAWDEASVGARWIDALERVPAKTDADRMLDEVLLAKPYKNAGKLERLIPLYMKLEADFPEDGYYPTALARVYLELGSVDEASVTIERAAKLRSSFRVVEVEHVRADIARMRGDVDAERAALREAIARIDRASPRSRTTLEDLRQRLADRLAGLDAR